VTAPTEPDLLRPVHRAVAAEPAGGPCTGLPANYTQGVSVDLDVPTAYSAHHSPEPGRVPGDRRPLRTNLPPGL